MKLLAAQIFTPGAMRDAVASWKLVAGCAVAMPLLMVLAARSFAPDLRPANARAQAPTLRGDPSLEVSDPAAGTTLPDLASLFPAAVRRAGEAPDAAPSTLRTDAFASPLSSRRSLAPRAVAVEHTAPVSNDDGSPAMPPAVRLTSTMISRGVHFAMLDNRLRKAGDRLSNGWRVESIDASAGRVLLRHDSGLEHVMSLRPEGDSR